MTDEQRNHVRELPLYPWALWISRLCLGAFAFMVTLAVTGQGGSLAESGFLFLFLLVVIRSIAARLVFHQMKRVLQASTFRDQARLGAAVNHVIYRDALLGSPTRK